MITDYIQTVYALIPPVLAILLAIFTESVTFSWIGILLGVLLLSQFSLWDASSLLIEKAVSLVWMKGGLNEWNFYIIGFLVFLGMMTSLMSVSGAAQAFGDAIYHKIKNRQQAQLLTALLGVVL